MDDQCRVGLLDDRGAGDLLPHAQLITGVNRRLDEAAVEIRLAARDRSWRPRGPGLYQQLFARFRMMHMDGAQVDEFNRRGGVTVAICRLMACMKRCDGRRDRIARLRVHIDRQFVGLSDIAHVALPADLDFLRQDAVGCHLGQSFVFQPLKHVFEHRAIDLIRAPRQGFHLIVLDVGDQQSEG